MPAIIRSSPRLPERFLLRNGSRVETRPIKGTRPRGETPEEDRETKSALARSPKDDAELSMIVDLLRNDIGKVCAGGSVVVVQHKRLEAYQNVYHLVSVVEGNVARGQGSRGSAPGHLSRWFYYRLSQDPFHGRSSTSWKSVVTDVTAGSIGHISFHDTMDLSIAIRTATTYSAIGLFFRGGRHCP